MLLKFCLVHVQAQQGALIDNLLLSHSHPFGSSWRRSNIIIEFLTKLIDKIVLNIVKCGFFGMNNSWNDINELKIIIIIVVHHVDFSYLLNLDAPHLIRMQIIPSMCAHVVIRRYKYQRPDENPTFKSRCYACVYVCVLWWLLEPKYQAWGFAPNIYPWQNLIWRDFWGNGTNLNDIFKYLKLHLDVLLPTTPKDRAERFMSQMK